MARPVPTDQVLTLFVKRFGAAVLLSVNRVKTPAFQAGRFQHPNGGTDTTVYTVVSTISLER